jgi:hypothetical protein
MTGPFSGKRFVETVTGEYFLNRRFQLFAFALGYRLLTTRRGAAQRPLRGGLTTIIVVVEVSQENDGEIPRSCHGQLF